MLCDVCQKNSASVHLTEIINAKVVEMHICQDCARDKASQLKESLSVSSLLGPLLDGIDPAFDRRVCCHFCGLTFREFKKKGRFGCGNCYTVFKDQLTTFLKNIHGSARYLGKTPVGALAKTSIEGTLKELKVKLASAIELENYEEAARLRDDIKNIEEKNKNV
jgi:protein arginine kinase activator